MKKLLYLILAGGLLFSCSEPQTTTTETPQVLVPYNPANYQPVPPNYGYMQDTVLLAAAVAGGDVATVRNHGWNMFAALLQPAAKYPKWPIWFTWPTTYDVFLPSFTPDSLTMTSSLLEKNKKNTLISSSLTSTGDTLPVFTNAPYYPLPEYVINNFGKVVNASSNSIAYGSHFLNNGDIMIATESFSIEAYNWIYATQTNKKSTLQNLYNNPVTRQQGLNLPQRYIVTKHMYWPVKQNQPSFVPIWNPNQFPNPMTYTGYAGYETWNDFAVINMSKSQVVIDSLPFLVGVYSDKSKQKSLTKYVKTSGVQTMYDLSKFYHHQVTEDEWNNVFSEADRAIITASTFWAYGKPFQPGDYLVMVAMHINTKEIPTWALQSIWWTNNPTGPYSAQRPLTNTPLDNYNMVDGYGIPDKITGNLPIGMNPYIELVSHPIATNCNNCHIRAGFPEGSTAGTASYQNPDCKYLLQKMDPATTSCLKSYLLTDFQWVIPDNLP